MGSRGAAEGARFFLGRAQRSSFALLAAFPVMLGSSPAAGTLLRRQLSKRLDGARYPYHASHEMAVIGVCH